MSPHIIAVAVGEDAPDLQAFSVLPLDATKQPSCQDVIGPVLSDFSASRTVDKETVIPYKSLSLGYSDIPE